MRQEVASLLALGIALAVPLSAGGALGEPVRHYRHHRTTAVRAEAPAAAILAPVRPAFGTDETNGLSRNPDDCARWGCVDNGGG